MLGFARLSPGPTLPEQLDAEIARHRRRLAALLGRTLGVRGWLWAALLLLGAATLLLRLRLIEPACAGRAFGAATRLTRRGLRGWNEAARSDG